MLNLNKFSLNIIIPSIIFSIFLLLLGTVFFVEQQVAQKKLYSEKEQYIKGIAGNLQTTLSNSLMRLEKAQAQNIVSETALDQNFKSIAVVDHNQQIVLSNNLRNKYMFAKLQLKYYDGELLNQVIEKNEFIFQYNALTQDLIVYAPMQMLSKGNSLNRKFNGLIFIRYSLTSAITELRYEALFSLIKMTVILLISLFVLIYIMNKFVVVPLNKLIQSTKSSDLNNLIEANSTGWGEIDVLQRAFSTLIGSVKNNIKEISDSEQRLQYALSGSRDGVWDWDIENDSIFYSDRWKEMFGFKTEDINETIEEWEYRIHEDDLTSVVMALNNHFSGQNSFFESTHRIRCHNGEYRWIVSRGQTVSWGGNGLPLRIIGTSTDVSRYKEQQEKLIYQAQLDAVTELPNRNQLLAHIDNISSRAKYQNLYCAIIFIECNHYKTIHDFEGNYRGDPLLYDIARRLEKLKTGNELIAHLSGSEFVAVLPDLHKEQDKATEIALEFTQKLDRSLKDIFVIEGEEIILSCAFGIELFPIADCNANDLLRQSQKAIIFSDENHFSNISFFTKDIEDKIQKRKQLQKQIHSGLDNDEFSLYFQPRVDIEGNLLGAEALIRWMHGSQGWVNPSEFIPVAEDSSLILPLGDWILKTAFKQLADWQKIGLPDTFTRLSINVSPKQLLQVGFTDLIKQYVEETQVDANRIEIEITEDVLINYKALAINKINRLREIGFCFAIDDFGTGYSSFSYLSILPVSTLKIDQSFIVDLMHNDNQQVIVSMIIKLAQSLQLEVVAEGVETQEQLTFLIEKGCTQFQGYLVGLPMAKQDFQTLLFKTIDSNITNDKK